MGLLAYKDPADSPLGYLVSALQNQAIADKVNDAVLGEKQKETGPRWGVLRYKAITVICALARGCVRREKRMHAPLRAIILL